MILAKKNATGLFAHRERIVLSAFTLLLIGHFSTILRAQADSTVRRSDQIQQEEVLDYYQKWLSEDVVYLITEEEKAVFSKLTTDEEREQFIEQFWFRRDPDIRTSNNEFKEEHYRRIAYANERFTSGVPGWRTDRGQTYVIHGPPTEIEKHYSGENYQRPQHEGGGFTAVFPFEIWRYHFIEGIGPDVEIEFVDPSGSGEFRFARDPSEKDAFLFFMGAGLTDAEGAGLASRADRPYFKPYNRDRYPLGTPRSIDDPFTRYERLNIIQRPLEIKYTDLKEIVDVQISYNNLPFRIRNDFFRLGDGRVLVPITFEIDNKDLTFQFENGVHVARVALYAIVTTISRRMVTEFEDDLLVSYQPQFLEKGLLGRSVYQKTLPLDGKMRYRIDVVIKDLNSEKAGVRREAIAPPAYGQEELEASSLVLSDSINRYRSLLSVDEMFLIGDIKVRPSLKKEFSLQKPFGVYLQLYNVQLDQSTQLPLLNLRYRILQNGKQVKYWMDQKGESIQYASDQRIVLVKGLPIQGLDPGDYRLEVEAEDRLKGETVTLTSDFSISG